MAKPKFGTDTVVKEEVLTTVAHMSRRGCTQEVIAKTVGVSQPMVSTYIRQIRKRYIERQLVDIGSSIEEELEKLNEVKWEAWQAWERSKEDAQRISNESKVTPFGVITTDKDEKRGQAGDPRYLKIVFDCWKEELALKGLEPPKKFEGKVQTLSWDSLASVIGNGVRDDVEDAIAQALGVGNERVQLGQVEAKDTDTPNTNGHIDNGVEE